jgi:hypothetical protein
LSSFSQGSPFNDCICILDWNTKDYDDEIYIYDKLSTGCCPRDTVPGVRATADYQSAMVVCGFNADGTITSSNVQNNGVCNYEQCYVDKQNLPCAGTDAKRQRINGCCGGNEEGRQPSSGGVTDATRLGYADSASCTGYAREAQTVHSTNNAPDYYEYCTHYHTDYSSATRFGTTESADDIDADETGFNTENYDTYTRCVGGGVDEDDSGAWQFGLSVFIAALAGLAL